MQRHVMNPDNDIWYCSNTARTEESTRCYSNVALRRSHRKLIFGTNSLILPIMLCALFILCFSIQTKAQTNNPAEKVDRYELSLEQLGQIAVISSKTPKLISDVTQKVDVITETQVKRTLSNNRNLAELIQYLPGASVKVLSRNDVNWGAYGGIGPKYNVYLLQGLPIDGFVDPMSLDANVIQRVEVQRGPASVLYSNYMSQDFAGNQSSLAGTINLVVKENVDKPATMASLNYGSYGTITGQLYHENRIGNASVFGGFRYEKSDYTNYGTPGSWLNMLKDPEYNKSRIYAGTTIPLDAAEDTKISIFGTYNIQHGDYGRINRGFDNYYGLLNISYTSHFQSGFDVAVKTGMRSYDRSWEDDNYGSVKDLSLAATSSVKQLIVPVDFSVSYKHGSGKTLVVGCDYQYATYKTTNEPVGKASIDGNDASAMQVGVYAQEEMQIDNLILRGGLRYSHSAQTINKFESQPRSLLEKGYDHAVWSAGVKYKLSPGWTVFANAGSSFLLPGLKALGGTIALTDTTNGQLPNHDLKPEQGIGTDIGIDAELPANLSVSARGFLNSINDAIIDYVVSQTPSQTRSANVSGKTIARGFEISLKQKIENSFDWFANVTYTKSEIKDNFDPDQNGVEIPFVPAVLGNAGVTFTLPYDIEIRPWAHFGGKIYDSNSRKGRNSYDSGVLLNVIVVKQFALPGGKTLEAMLSLYNVTDNKFKMPWQFMDPGFNITAGCRFDF